MRYTYLRSILDSREPVCDNQSRAVLHGDVPEPAVAGFFALAVESRSRPHRGNGIGGFCLYPREPQITRRRMGGGVGFKS